GVSGGEAPWIKNERQRVSHAPAFAPRALRRGLAGAFAEAETARLRAEGASARSRRSFSGGGSAPTQRRARERVGGSRGRSPLEKNERQRPSTTRPSSASKSREIVQGLKLAEAEAEHVSPQVQRTDETRRHRTARPEPL